MPPSTPGGGYAPGRDSRRESCVQTGMTGSGRSPEWQNAWRERIMFALARFVMRRHSVGPDECLESDVNLVFGTEFRIDLEGLPGKGGLRE